MLKTIQSGRGLAALAVTAFHLSIFFADPRYLGHPVMEELTSLGGLGVDFFFVLSGFIIMHAHHKDIGLPKPEAFSALKLYALKRFIRLMPVYWLYTLGYSLLVLLGVGTAATIPGTVTEWISSLSLIRFSAFHPPLHPAWTLFHEVAFYGVFAILIWNLRYGLAALFLWTTITIGVFQYAHVDHRTPFATYFSAYNLNFIIGMASYFLWKRSILREGIICAILGLVLLVVVGVLNTQGITFAGTGLLYAIAFGVIMSGFTILETHDKIRTLPLLVPLGNASYTIYLTHEPIMGVFVKIVLWLNKKVPLPHPVLYLGVLSATLIAGYVVYLVVEKPLIALCKKLFMGKPKTAKAIPQNA